MEELPSITASQREQFLVENDVFGMYSYFDSSDIATQKFMVEIQRDKQLDYLMNGLRQLGPSFSSLDANRPWVCYWIIHSIALLGESVDDDLENNAIDFLGRCQGSDGGYGGGPGQQLGFRFDLSQLNRRRRERRFEHPSNHRGKGGGVMEELPSITVSQREQFLVENDVFGMYSYFDTSDIATQKFIVEIHRDKQLDYLMNGLRQLGPSFSSLDANRPWVCYWIIHSIALLGESVDDDLENNAIDFLGRCQSVDDELENNTIDFLGRCQGSDGGYSGGPGQLAHLATSYAAVNTLVTLGGDKALSSVNRVHDMGEMDVRACYLAISIASILNILDDELTRGLGDYILSCQTYEGGIGGEPGSEAYAGNTYCGLATITMALITEVDRLNSDSLMLPHLATSYAAVNTLVTLGGEKAFSSINREQMACFLRRMKDTNGGFRMHNMGEIDVRACYTAISIASILNIVDDELTRGLGDYILSCQTYEGGIGGEPGSEAHGGYTYCGLATMILINEVDRLNLDSLMNWIVHRQGVEMGFQGRTNKLVDGCYTFWQVADGGFRDKLRKPRDFYHTCYCLSGLSVAQHAWSKDEDTPPLTRDILGGYANHLEPVHLLHNVVMDRYNEAIEFFHRAA
ncbi:hypothetical protein F2Q68_00026937 [Brassica cretica]|uniref:Protein farnesyltransferase subunit beta n=1 Tax=Brassica cretica TaxID=69181 RepID=A0A8S9I6S9_BRACR|nr:hypothetical protein F2Q68_00026937 [Brassica cretica]